MMEDIDRHVQDLILHNHTSTLKQLVDQNDKIEKLDLKLDSQVTQFGTSTSEMKK